MARWEVMFINQHNNNIQTQDNTYDIDTYKAMIGQKEYLVKSKTPLHTVNALSKDQIADRLYRIFSKYTS